MLDDQNCGSLSPEGKIAFEKMKGAHAASADHLTTLQLLLDHEANMCHGFSNGHISNIVAGLELFILGHLEHVPLGIRPDWYQLLKSIAKVWAEFSFEDTARDAVEGEVGAIACERPPRYFESALDREDDL